jgi:hypothetical protein
VRLSKTLQEVLQVKVKQLGANQTEIVLDSGNIVLVSYETPVAAFIDGKYVKTRKKWSRTTSKHVNKWCPKNAQELDQEFFDKIFTSPQLLPEDLGRAA